MYTTFSISDIDIEHGKYQSTRSCPLALALSEILPDNTYVSIVEAYTTIDENKCDERDPNKTYPGERWYKHSVNLRNWIISFDKSKTFVKPIELVLDNSNHIIWTKEEHNEYWNRAD